MAEVSRNAREDARFRLLRLLHENPEMSQRQLARSVGISVGNMNLVLNALIEKGLVKAGSYTAAPDTRRYSYILTRKGMAEKAALTRDFLDRKRVEIEALKAEIESLEAELGDAGEMHSAKGR